MIDSNYHNSEAQDGRLKPLKFYIREFNNTRVENQ